MPDRLNVEAFKEAFKEINQAVIAGRKLEEVLTLIVRRSQRLTAFNYVTLGLVDGEGGLKFDVHPIKPGL